jgi:hypothetical protein
MFLQSFPFLILGNYLSYIVHDDVVAFFLLHKILTCLACNQENLGQMQGSQAEVTRLLKCVAKSRKNFCRLQWNNAYFSDPEAFFSSVVSVSIIPAYKSMNFYCLIIIS